MNYASMKKDTIDLNNFTRLSVDELIETGTTFTINQTVYHQYSNRDGEEQTYYTCLDTHTRRFINSFTSLYHFLTKIEEGAIKAGKTLNEQLEEQPLVITFLKKRSSKNGKLMFDFNVVETDSTIPF